MPLPFYLLSACGAETGTRRPRCVRQRYHWEAPAETQDPSGACRASPAQTHVVSHILIVKLHQNSSGRHR